MFRPPRPPRKKKGGKGLSILSGRDLFHFKKELFVDDEAAENVEVSKIRGLDGDLEDATSGEESIFDFGASLRREREARAAAGGEPAPAAAAPDAALEGVEARVSRVDIAGNITNDELFLEGEDDDLVSST